MNKGGYIYILTNKNNTVLYTGVSNSLLRRIEEHRSGKDVKSFTTKYNCTKLVYFEFFDNIEEAIIREKYIKGKKRLYKLELIKELNPNWDNLFEQREDYSLI